MSDTTEDTAGPVSNVAQDNGPRLNRAQRRAQEREKRHAAKLITPQQQQEMGARMLMETIVQNRGDAVMRALTALFEQDPVDGAVWRLTGLGGATGQISGDRLNEIANGAVTSGLLLPGVAEQTEVEPDPTEGGVLIGDGGTDAD